LQGLNAVATLSADGELVVAKNGSPIVLGVGEGSAYLSSYPTALLAHTKKVIFLEDGQMALLNDEKISVYSLSNGKKVPAKVQTLDWEYSQASTGSYRHFMIKEIYEQPKVIRYCAESLEESATALARLVAQLSTLAWREPIFSQKLPVST
jgi:glucosamine--fructose-6-phosphate aminotransferase (isomerizing)